MIQRLNMKTLSMCVCALALIATGPVMAQSSAYGIKASNPKGLGVQTQSSQGRTQVLNLPKGRSAVIDLPMDAADVFVSNPAVADAVLRTPRRIFVLGVGSGQSDALFFDHAGRQILSLSIRVEAPTDQLSDTISRLYPEAQVDVQSLNGFVVLNGVVPNAAMAENIQRLAAAFASKPENVINTLAIAGKDQVMLKVRIVEVQKSTIKQLGFSFDVLSGVPGEVQYGIQNTASFGVNSKPLGGGSLSYADKLLNSNLQAFERVGLVRTLAEPNLTAISGEGAKFLAGGEFPVPVAQDNQGRVTVEFKPFGVGLGFTPVVLSEGRIALKLSTEVSELTNTGAFSLNANFTIPALSVRRAETSVEMQSGSSLMIAGLLQSKFKQSLDALPGMTSLPILGALFRSRDFLSDETELVVIVTPYIVTPNAPGSFQTPADNLQISGDMESVFLGRMNKAVKEKRGDMSASSGATGGYNAPIGYVIE
jgi:pilus assembly protein CpaC